MDNETKNKFDLGKFGDIELEPITFRDKKENRAIEFRRRLIDSVPTASGVAISYYSEVWSMIENEIPEMRIPEKIGVSVHPKGIEMVWFSPGFSVLSIYVGDNSGIEMLYLRRDIMAKTISDKCSYRREFPELLRAWNPILRIFA